jgi:hypothetical protein
LAPNVGRLLAVVEVVPDEEVLGGGGCADVAWLDENVSVDPDDARPRMGA